MSRQKLISKYIQEFRCHITNSFYWVISNHHQYWWIWKSVCRNILCPRYVPRHRYQQECHSSPWSRFCQYYGNNILQSHTGSIYPFGRTEERYYMYSYKKRICFSSLVYHFIPQYIGKLENLYLFLNQHDAFVPNNWVKRQLNDINLACKWF